MALHCYSKRDLISRPYIYVTLFREFQSRTQPVSQTPRTKQQCRFRDIWFAKQKGKHKLNPPEHYAIAVLLLYHFLFPLILHRTVTHNYTYYYLFSMLWLQLESTWVIVRLIYFYFSFLYLFIYFYLHPTNHFKPAFGQFSGLQSTPTDLLL